MPTPQQIRDLYRFPGFVPLARLQVHPHDPQGVVLTLRRRRKKRAVAGVAIGSPASMIKGPAASVTWPAGIAASISPSPCAGWTAGGVAR
jgi:hypothetical protein